MSRAESLDRGGSMEAERHGAELNQEEQLPNNWAPRSREAHIVRTVRSLPITSAGVDKVIVRIIAIMQATLSVGVAIVMTLFGLVMVLFAGPMAVFYAIFAVAIPVLASVVSAVWLYTGKLGARVLAFLVHAALLRFMLGPASELPPEVAKAHPGYHGNALSLPGRVLTYYAAFAVVYLAVSAIVQYRRRADET